MSSSDWKPMGRPAKGDFLPLFMGEGQEDFQVLGGNSEQESPDPQEEAERILREAKQRADLIQREAFEKGFSQGERAGRELAERAMEETLGALQQVVAQLDLILKDTKGDMALEIVRLALAVARKILQREVSLDRGTVLQVVKAALAKARLREDVIVRVNPMDLESLLEAKGELLRELEEVRSIRVEADESVERGGALVECSMGELDLRLERQFKEIEQAFQRLLEEGKGPTSSWEDLSEAEPV